MLLRYDCYYCNWRHTCHRLTVILHFKRVCIFSKLGYKINYNSEFLINHYIRQFLRTRETGLFRGIREKEREATNDKLARNTFTQIGLFNIRGTEKEFKLSMMLHNLLYNNLTTTWKTATYIII